MCRNRGNLCSRIKVNYTRNYYFWEDCVANSFGLKMDNLKTNTSGAYLWQPPQQPQSQIMQQSSVPPPPQQPPPPASLLSGMPQPVRRFAGNKNNYNYVHSQAQAAADFMMGTSSPATHLMGLGSPNPNGYRKRQPMNTGYSPAGYQHNGKRQILELATNVCHSTMRQQKKMQCSVTWHLSDSVVKHQVIHSILARDTEHKHRLRFRLRCITENDLVTIVLIFL